jgi:hypothetical protein
MSRALSGLMTPGCATMSRHLTTLPTSETRIQMTTRRTSSGSRKSKPRRTTQTVKGGLRGFSEAKKSGVPLIKEIQTHVVAQGVLHGNDNREDHKIHVSELVKDTCPRKMFYKITEAETSDPPAPSYHLLEMMWAAGHAEHEKWQRWLREMGDLWGSWKCLQCEAKWEDTSPDACTKCGGVLLKYLEVNLESGDHSLVGHADGAVPRLNALVEVKSFATGTVRVENPSLVAEHTHKVNGKSVIDHDGLWDAVKRPLRSHLVQGMMYLWLCRLMGLPYDRIIFIYENKTNQKTKAFEVKYTERFIKEHLETLEGVCASAAEGVAPARPKAFAPDARPCKDCPFRTLCWSDRDTGEESTPVSIGGPRSRSEEAGGAAEVRPPSPAPESDPERPRRHHRTGRPRTARADDRDDAVERAPRRATRDGRGGRAVGRGGDGEGESPRFARRRR